MKSNIAIFFAALGTLILNGCMTSSQPATMADPSAFNQPLPAIYVMPVIDARDDKSATFDSGDTQRILDLTKNKLEGLGYQTVMVNSWQSNAAATDPGLAGMNDAALCQLAPADSKIFLVIKVTDEDDTYEGIMASYSISGTFTLIDRAKGIEIWKDHGKGSHGAGGIIGSAVASADKRVEGQNGFVNILSNLPENKK